VIIEVFVWSISFTELRKASKAGSGESGAGKVGSA